MLLSFVSTIKKYLISFEKAYKEALSIFRFKANIVNAIVHDIYEIIVLHYSYKFTKLLTIVNYFI